MTKPEVTTKGVFDMQVCVPEEWTDEQILEFAEKKFPTGIKAKWFIRKLEEVLDGDLERQPCDDNKNYVHIMLDV